MSDSVPEEPRVQERAAQPYVGIRHTVRMDGIGEAIGSSFPELFGWLAGHGLQPAGAPFVRYHVVDMDGELELEPGVPTSSGVAGDDRVQAGTLPAGSWATLLHAGPYDQLVAANADLQRWVSEQGLAFDREGSRWHGRVEHYLNDPQQEPDPAGLLTEVAYLLAAS